MRPYALLAVEFVAYAATLAILWHGVSTLVPQGRTAPAAICAMLGVFTTGAAVERITDHWQNRRRREGN